MQRRLFQIELPLHPGWDAILPLRASVLACVRTVFPQPNAALALALVAAELLENAVKFGAWDEGAAYGDRGQFTLRVVGSDGRLEIEVSNPVSHDDGHLERLENELARIASSPSPEEAYVRAVRGLALGRESPLGLARAAHEGGCELTARVEGDIVTVRAVTRRISSDPAADATQA